MKGFLIGLIWASILVIAVPASAQVWVDAGPFAMRVGPPPPWGWHRHHWVREREFVYVPECRRIIRERERPWRGDVVVREREVCH